MTFYNYYNAASVYLLFILHIKSHATPLLILFEGTQQTL
jgi:hypothetical protein